MKEVKILVDIDFLIAMKDARANIRSLDLALKELKSDETESLVDPETLKDMTDYYQALKKYYNKVYKAGMNAIMAMENETERNILICTYIKSMKHVDARKELGLAKETYWVKLRSAKAHFKAPVFKSKFPMPPKEEDYL